VCKYLEREEIDRRQQRYLLGVGFVQSSVKTAKTLEPSEPKSMPVDTARVSSVLESEPESEPKNIGSNVGSNAEILQSLTQSDLQNFGSDGSNDFQILLDFCNSFSKLSDANKQKLTKLLTGVPCSDPLKAFRVGDKVAGNRQEDASYNWHGRIVEIDTSITCKVDWQEREGMRGGRVISMLFCNLRKI
jgi:hypothetical protein